MNGLGEPFRKKSDHKSEKKASNRQGELLFKHRFLTIREKSTKNYTPQNPSLLHSVSCFGLTKITAPI